MYHLVGDCDSTAKEKKNNNIKTHLLEGLVSNAISNKTRDMTAAWRGMFAVLELQRGGSTEIVVSFTWCEKVHLGFRIRLQDRV